jgi:hypothetical protein
MLNRDKRSLVLSLVLGDGCLHYIKNRGKLYGGLTIDHGLEQADYQSWKAKLLSDIFQRDVKMRNGHKGKSVQVSVCEKRLRAWRKFCYPNDRKSVPKILKFITNPYFAIAVWLMDDGYVEPSFSKLKNGDKKNYGARFRIFTNSQTLEEVEEIKKWFTDLGLEPKIKLHSDNGKQVPIIKFTQKDSLIIWEKIREFVLTFKSMQYKFRYIEDIYKLKLSQAQGSDKITNDIVDA